MKDQHKILVIDDELSICKGCQRIFEEEGHSIKFALSGREGLEHVDTEVFDVAIIDLKMPDIDGIEVMKSIKERQPSMAMIMITGYASVPTAVEAIKVGAEDFIPKPFTPDEILTVVNKVLERLPQNAEPAGQPRQELRERHTLDSDGFETKTDIQTREEFILETSLEPDVFTAESQEHAPDAHAPERDVYIEKDHVLAVLNRAIDDVEFFTAFLDHGRRHHVLENHPLDGEAAAAIISGDIGWLEKTVGPLTPEQKEFLMRRLCIEAW